jgi:hypothetical protein
MRKKIGVLGAFASQDQGSCKFLLYPSPSKEQKKPPLWAAFPFLAVQAVCCERVSVQFPQISERYDD